MRFLPEHSLAFTPICARTLVQSRPCGGVAPEWQPMQLVLRMACTAAVVGGGGGPASFRMNVAETVWLPTRSLTPQLMSERKVPRKYSSPVALFTDTPDVPCTAASPAALAHRAAPVVPSSFAVNASVLPADVKVSGPLKVSALANRPPMTTL